MHPLFLSISVTLYHSLSYLTFHLFHLYTLRFVPYIYIIRYRNGKRDGKE
nr:MAG TPA: hypothetical protein [Caudoviricetes sp.]